MGDADLHPLIAIDVVPIAGGGPREVLIGSALRPNDPFAGTWALPGVILVAGESLDEAAMRALRNKAGVDPESVSFIVQIGAFDTPNRDPRDHVISVAYVAVFEKESARKLRWSPDPRDLSFDHGAIIARAREELRVRWLTDLEFTRALTGERFSTTDAVHLAESVTGAPQRPSNLMRRMCGTGEVVRSDERARPGAGRPSVIWRWT